MARKRKFLSYTGITILAFIAIAYVFRKLVFLLVAAALIKPPTPFDVAKAPPAPDYANAAAWAALPDKDDPSDWVPEGLPKEDNPLRDKADVFYIHPTGYFGKTWNAAADAKLLIPTEAMLASQATPLPGWSSTPADTPDSSIKPLR